MEIVLIEGPCEYENKELLINYVSLGYTWLNPYMESDEALELFNDMCMHITGKFVMTDKHISNIVNDQVFMKVDEVNTIYNLEHLETLSRIVELTVIYNRDYEYQGGYSDDLLEISEQEYKQMIELYDHYYETINVNKQEQKI